MNPLDALHLQLRLEGKEALHGDLLRQVELVPDEDMPLMVIVQLADGQVVAYFDESTAGEFRTELKELVNSFSFPNIDPLETFLQDKKILFEASHYKTYTFPKTYETFTDGAVVRCSKHDPKVKTFGFDIFVEDIFAIEKDGRIVSSCVSTRENDLCGEAWTFTDEQCRRQGLAQKAVSAWAAGLLMAGKVPFYSHKIQNTASASLAKRLGLQPLFEEIVISYTNV